MLEIKVEEEYYKINSDKTRPKVRFKHKPCRTLEDKAKLLSSLDFEINKVEHECAEIESQLEYYRRCIDTLMGSSLYVAKIREQMHDKRDKIYDATPEGNVFKIKKQIENLYSRIVKHYRKLDEVSCPRYRGDPSKQYDVEYKIKLLKEQVVKKESQLEVANEKVRISKQIGGPSISCIPQSRRADKSVRFISEQNQTDRNSSLSPRLDTGNNDAPISITLHPNTG